MADPPSHSSKAAALCAAAAMVCLPLTAQSEGLRFKPYLDPAHILTVCYGETSNIDPSKIYSSDQCAVMLRHRLATDYAPRLLACLPELYDQRLLKMFGALLDAAYNAGPVAVCNSRMARNVHAKNWAGACSSFIGWYVTARDRRTGQRIELSGLAIRRQKEAALCRQTTATVA